MANLRLGDSFDEPFRAPGSREVHHDEIKRKEPGGTATVSSTSPAELGGMPAGEAKEWVNAQIPYENLASRRDVEQRVAGYVRDQQMRWEKETQEWRDKCRAINHLLRGRSTSWRFEGSGNHSPKLYQRVETIVPRIEEALIGYDPWFTVRGHGNGDRMKERAARDFLLWQLRENHWSHIVQPNIRSGLVYGHSPIKVFWDVQTEHRIIKEIERIDRPGKVEYKITRKEQDTCVWMGPRIKLVDPLDFIIDHKSYMPPYDTLYMGDVTLVSLGELRAKQAMGLYQNVEKLENMRPQSRWGELQYDKIQRSLRYAHYDPWDNPVDGTEKMFPVSEVWGPYDLYNNGRPVQCVLTVANRTVVLRAQENPHDEKHLPYAPARVAREPFEFLSVGPLDHAVALNEELDDHRSTGLRAALLAASPIAFVDESSDAPDSLFDVEPGSVFHSDRPPSWFQPPNNMQVTMQAEALIERDIEMVTGAPRLYSGEGGGGGDTATEFQGLRQESNQRLRSFVLSYSLQAQTILGIMHKLNRQYMTADTTYRVVGRDGRLLPEYHQITPIDLDMDVEIEMVGPARLQTLGLRATQIASFMGALYPYMPLLGNKVKVDRLVGDLYENMVGSRPTAEVVNLGENQEEMMSQEEENRLMENGRRAKVSEYDNDEKHIEEMADYLPGGDRFSKLPERIQDLFLSHAAEHEESAERKQEEKRLAEEAVAQQQMLQGEGGTDRDRGTTGARRRDTEMLGAGPNVPGETPGPGMAHQVAAGDRVQATPQTVNR